MMNHIKVFISYSHKDKKWLGDLKTHLRPLERDRLIEIWDDTQIKVGTYWSQEIEDALSTTNVAILLVSAEFLASEFISTNELPSLLIAAEAKGTLILPIIVSACDFKHSELHKFQAFNSPDKPMDKMQRANRHELLQKVADRVREVVDGIKAETTIASDIVEALKAKFNIAVEPSVFKPYIVNSEAYKCYIKGRHLFYQHTKEEWLKAIDYFERVTFIEPDNGSAYARLSSVLAFAWFYGAMHPDEAIEKWRNTNNRALALGSELAETHIAVGRFRLLYERNWEEAEREYKRAVEIDPNNADAYQQYGLLLAAKGHFQEAIRKAKKALILDQTSLLVNFHAAAIYWLSSQWDEALRQIESMIELFPNSNSAYWVKGLIYSMTGEHGKAIEAYLKSIDLRDDNHALSSLAYTYGLSGQKKEALRVIDKLIERQRQRYDIDQTAPYATAYNIAVAYGGLRENDEAFKWLKHAYRENNGDLIYLKVHSTIGGEGIWGKHFRDNQRFRDFLLRVGFR